MNDFKKILYVFDEEACDGGVQVRVYRGFCVTCNHSRVHGRSSYSGLSATVEINPWPRAFYPRGRSRVSYALCFFPNA